MWKAVLCTHRIQRPFCKSLHCSDVAGECFIFPMSGRRTLRVFFAFAKPFFGGGRGVLVIMNPVSLPAR